MRSATNMAQVIERIVAISALAMLAASPAFAADAQRGRALYENHCQACHSSKVHRREHKQALDAQELSRIVDRWQQEQRLRWSNEEIDDVVSYLRESVYRF